jgi:hypothetical protein
MDEFFSALIGAIVGGLIAVLGGFKLDEHQRNKCRENLRSAIAMEVASIVELVERREYAAHLRAFAEYLLELPPDQMDTFRLPVKQHYFTIYETNAASIGELPAIEAVEIICFYQQARSVLDSFPEDVTQEPWVTKDDLVEFYKGLAKDIDNICAFGKQLVGKLTTVNMTKYIKLTADPLSALDRQVAVDGAAK